MLKVLHPLALLPVLRAEMTDDETALDHLHDRLLEEHGQAAVASAWAKVFVAACAETHSWPDASAAAAVTVRSEMVGRVLAALEDHGHESSAERACALAVAGTEDPGAWLPAVRAAGLSDVDAAWGFSRIAVAAANTVAVLLEGRGAWDLPEGHVAADDEAAAARDDALARIARRVDVLPDC